MGDEKKFDSGAKRSSDADHLSYVSIPPVGLMLVARVAAEGEARYGRWNYMLGMPASDLLNHAMRHQNLWLSGDRSEAHLAKAAWGLLAACQAEILDPEQDYGNLLSAGCVVGHDVLQTIEAHKAIKCEAWDPEDVPEVQMVLVERHWEACDEEALDGEPCA